MRSVWISAFVVLVSLAMTAGATHDAGCFYTYADPASVLEIQIPVDDPNDADSENELIYDEERGNPFGAPIPFSSALFGADCDGGGCCDLTGCAQGTWFYEETNDVPGLQRGGSNVLGEWFPPGCDQTWEYDFDDPTNLTVPDGTGPCWLYNVDPIEDETCGHGPDRLVIHVWLI